MNTQTIVVIEEASRTLNASMTDVAAAYPRARDYASPEAHRTARTAYEGHLGRLRELQASLEVIAENMWSEVLTEITEDNSRAIAHRKAVAMFIKPSVR